MIAFFIQKFNLSVTKIHIRRGFISVKSLYRMGHHFLLKEDGNMAQPLNVSEAYAKLVEATSNYLAHLGKVELKIDETALPQESVLPPQIPQQAVDRAVDTAAEESVQQQAQAEGDGTPVEETDWDVHFPQGAGDIFEGVTAAEAGAVQRISEGVIGDTYVKMAGPFIVPAAMDLEPASPEEKARDQVLTEPAEFLDYLRRQVKAAEASYTAFPASFQQIKEQEIEQETSTAIKLHRTLEYWRSLLNISGGVEEEGAAVKLNQQRELFNQHKSLWKALIKRHLAAEMANSLKLPESEGAEPVDTSAQEEQKRQAIEKFRPLFENKLTAKIMGENRTSSGWETFGKIVLTVLASLTVVGGIALALGVKRATGRWGGLFQPCGASVNSDMKDVMDNVRVAPRA